MGDLISSLLFQPPPPTYLHPSRHFWLTNKYGNRIPAFFIERPNAKVTILFSHGNAEDLGMIYDWFNDLARVLRVNIMAYDYSGYGKSMSGTAGNGNGNGNGNGRGSSSYGNSSSRINGGSTSSQGQGPGSSTPNQSRSHHHHHHHHSRSSNGPLHPCEEFVYADIEAAYDYLLNERSIQPSEIVLYGRSLGSGPTCYLASKTASRGPQHSVAGVILQSPLLSAFRVAFNFRFTMIYDKFPNIDYAPHIKCPVFIVHGTQDEVVPFWHGQDLWLNLEQKWRAKPFWVEGAGHNNIEALLRPSGAFVDKLIEFLDMHIAAREKIPNTTTTAAAATTTTAVDGSRSMSPRGPMPVPECVSASASATHHHHISHATAANGNNTRTMATATSNVHNGTRLMTTSSQSQSHNNLAGSERTQTTDNGNVDSRQWQQGESIV